MLFSLSIFCHLTFWVLHLSVFVSQACSRRMCKCLRVSVYEIVFNWSMWEVNELFGFLRLKCSMLINNYHRRHLFTTHDFYPTIFHWFAYRTHLRTKIYVPNRTSTFHRFWISSNPKEKEKEDEDEILKHFVNIVSKNKFITCLNHLFYAFNNSTYRFFFIFVG